ncbi:uroporphyrinogen decarboxylase family protein [Novipirellula artificiosorum]|uniref:Uroporphyrinogen decarboxylase (URO-D) n=1 Tax=Novipirellula artificiosorum TaxID=2528016 RepID=A0A5C6DC01_9BACT|nr:uroporphyrinogen decarboxylase family protein [Novipirellula artificiosorum]TWU34342.1 Uroporphyrinogen decarboxylase (URO-D) [Novipirellula artificiosorum]
MNASNDFRASEGLHAASKATLYAERFARYTTAMRNEMPDRVPIRPFVAEFTGVYAGYNCQELTHNYENAFDAACQCASGFEWDAVVANMVYVWTGLAQSMGLKYYAIPGIDIPAETGFQYREPKQDDAFMKADEYDALIEDPTGFLYNVWLPRVADSIVPIGQPSTTQNNLALVKTGMAMMQYFTAFGPQVDRLRTECGTVSAISGILKAPMDILADKLRGYLGLVDDLFERPEKVLAACEALAPHLGHVAKATADPNKGVPVTIWMHRGGVPFVSPKIFKEIYWSTLKPIIQDLWSEGLQTLFYAEGSWDYHLESFAELPDRSIIYHVDQGDIFKTHDVLGDKFCLSGGVANTLLSMGTHDEIRKRCKEIIDRVAQDGGYIMDASAIVQNDATVDRMRVMTEATLEYGVYSRGHSAAELKAGGPKPLAEDAKPGTFLPPPPVGHLQPGECFPWDQKRLEIGTIQGDEAICKQTWQEMDALSNMFIWQLLLSF